MRLLTDQNVLKFIKKPKKSSDKIDTTELINVLEALKDGNSDVHMSCKHEGIAKRVAEALNQIIQNYRRLERSNAELEQFAFIASHDLQEPLRMVTCYTQLLERNYYDKLDQDALDYIHFAVDGSKRMQHLICDLLDYSRISSEKKELELADTAVILRVTLNVLDKIISENNATITFDTLPVIKCNAKQVQRVFQNLILNSIKYRKKSEVPKIHISCKKQKGNYIFSISDNGIGIDPKYHDEIFKIFSRVETEEEYPGTGIGLTICKRIVECHNGQIWIDSKPGNGTTFYFTLGNA